jgi:hypothetical protein
VAVGDESVTLPVYHLDNAPPWLADTAPALDPALLRTLEQSGHRVERQHSIVPFEMDDGARILVPVDSYRITPAVHRIQ